MHLSKHCEPERLYLLTREDLGAGQSVVQSAHALAELLMEHAHDP